MGLAKIPTFFIAECFLAVIQVKQISQCSQGEIALPTKYVMCYYAQGGPCHPQCAEHIVTQI